MQENRYGEGLVLSFNLRFMVARDFPLFEGVAIVRYIYNLV